MKYGRRSRNEDTGGHQRARPRPQGESRGLLDAAVDVVSKFVPRGSPIVTTKGRKPEADKIYQSTEEPLLPSTPLVVLTDRGAPAPVRSSPGLCRTLTAHSSSEQGRSARGSSRPSPPQLRRPAQDHHGPVLYPSGRSIQEIDYQHRDRNGVFATVPDSLKREFKTLRGRKEFEFGGIAPDSLVRDEDVGPMVRELMKRALIFKFANSYISGHKGRRSPQPATRYSPRSARSSTGRSSTTRKRWRGRSPICARSPSGHIIQRKSPKPRPAGAQPSEGKTHGFERYKDHITNELNIELMARLHGDHGRIEASLKEDAQLLAAEDC